MQAVQGSFGMLSDGSPIDIVTLRNDRGLALRVMTLGATMQSLEAPGLSGPDDVLLGHDTPAPYFDQPQYFGATVGRFANRIEAGKFDLDGKTYQLETNDGTNHLHGGVRGLDKRIWNIDSISGGRDARVVMSCVSRDGEGGYPGELRITATFTLNEESEVGIAYSATTSRPTIVSITNHNFYNLSGASALRSVCGHRLTVPASAITPVNETLIPTGAMMPVEGTPFDFRKAQAIGARIACGRSEQIRRARGYDHNFIVDGAGEMRLMARLDDKASGRIMELLSTAPGLQVYSGNFLDGQVIGKGGRLYRQSDAICLEPQAFPDAPNKPAFPSARLDPGQTYENRILLRFSISK